MGSVSSIVPSGVASASSISPRLISRCAQALSRAEAYIRGRQSPDGGFCFYLYGPIDEPNLADTYHAVAALRLLGSEVPLARETADFVRRARTPGLTYLYFRAFTLDELGLADLVGTETLERIRALTITPPHAARSMNRGDWLESVRKKVRLRRRFARNGDSEAAQWVEYMRRQADCGVRRNLRDTYLAVSVGSLLGFPTPRDTVEFVESLQSLPIGFRMTRRSSMPSLEVAYAGARCCDLLRLPVRHAREVIEFTLACQSADGGFAHAPTGLPNLELTCHALRLIALLAPESIGKR